MTWVHFYYSLEMYQFKHLIPDLDIYNIDYNLEMVELLLLWSIQKLLW